MNNSDNVLPPLDDPVSRIKWLLGESKIEEAIEEYGRAYDTQNSVVLRGRLKRLEQDHRLGQVGYADYQVELSRLSASLLELLPQSETLGLPPRLDPAPAQNSAQSPANPPDGTTPTAANLAVPDTNPAGIEWIEIPAGEFFYGRAQEKMQIYQPFYIARYPVTTAQFLKFLLANPQQHLPPGWDSQTRSFPPGKEDHPVVNLPREVAQAFCQWALGHQPTEEEWEKAARGTDGRKYPWGDQAPNHSLANFGKHEGGTTRVGRNSPQGDSPYGCVDMAGNVFEWTSSPYLWSLHLCGGAWDHSAFYLPAAERRSIGFGANITSVGLRCVRDM